MVDAVASDFRVLLALRLRGLAGVSVIAERAGMPEAEATTVLDTLERTADVEGGENAAFGLFWKLTDGGEGRILNLLAEELDETHTRLAVSETYKHFFGANDELLELCTNWQVLATNDLVAEPCLNDHSDPAYDAAVVAQLVSFDERMQPIYLEFGEHLLRFVGYGPRFTHALDQLRVGNYDWFAGMLVESYHIVWMELHYNLQSTLGINRASEEALSRA